MNAPEINVRIGELAVADAQGGVLVSIGLGSCIGLAMLDATLGLAGLAHIMLPSRPGTAPATPGKYADLAVPALIERLEGRGARRRRLVAVLVGGARMFASSTTGNMDVGARNEAMTREALGAAGIPVRDAATGGSTGRTIRVLAREGVVVVREVGAEARELYRAPTGLASGTPA